MVNILYLILKSFYCTALKKNKDKFAKTSIVITNALMLVL